MSPKEIEMTHDELLARIDNPDAWDSDGWGYLQKALRAVVELHKPDILQRCCSLCLGIYDNGTPIPAFIAYPCATIKAIEKELG
jgi:hypothetical protein